MLAMVKAVADFPRMNAHYDDEAEVVRRHGGVHIGIATQTPSGLMVPVARHAEARDLWDCAAEVKRLADAARGGRATREELSGSTITITSLGALGGIASTPVINRPEVAIVGVNRMAIRPVWQDGGVVPRKMMNLSSSFDHRVDRRLRRGGLHPAHQEAARNARDDLHGELMRAGPAGMPRRSSRRSRDAAAGSQARRGRLGRRYAMAAGASCAAHRPSPLLLSLPGRPEDALPDAHRCAARQFSAT